MTAILRHLTRSRNSARWGGACHVRPAGLAPAPHVVPQLVDGRSSRSSSVSNDRCTVPGRSVLNQYPASRRTGSFTGMPVRGQVPMQVGLGIGRAERKQPQSRRSAMFRRSEPARDVLPFSRSMNSGSPNAPPSVPTLSTSSHVPAGSTCCPSRRDIPQRGDAPQPRISPALRNGCMCRAGDSLVLRHGRYARGPPHQERAKGQNLRVLVKGVYTCFANSQMPPWRRRDRTGPASRYRSSRAARRDPFPRRRWPASTISSRCPYPKAPPVSSGGAARLPAMRRRPNGSALVTRCRNFTA